MATDVGQILRSARKHAGKTQGELAAMMGTQQSVISRWERGERSPTIEQLGELLAALEHTLVLSAKPLPKSGGRGATGLLLGRE